MGTTIQRQPTFGHAAASAATGLAVGSVVGGLVGAGLQAHDVTRTMTPGFAATALGVTALATAGALLPVNVVSGVAMAAVPVGALAGAIKGASMCAAKGQHALMPLFAAGGALLGGAGGGVAALGMMAAFGIGIGFRGHTAATEA